MWKRRESSASGGDQEDERERIAAEVSKFMRRRRNRGGALVPGRARRVPVFWPRGGRHGGGASPICCSCTERGKAHLDTVVLGCGAAASWSGAATGSVSSGQNREGLSTVAGCAGG